jgi:hypothetical protein
MEFFGHTLIWDWCRQNGYALDEGVAMVAPKLANDPSLVDGERTVHAAAGDVEASKALASRILKTLGNWDCCLLWATEWDVWEDIEDWPRYYAWRALFGEKRSLSAAPGHLFRSEEQLEILRLLSHALECGWDTTILPVREGRPSGIRLRSSHDEWIQFTAIKPVTLPATAV